MADGIEVTGTAEIEAKLKELMAKKHEAIKQAIDKVAFDTEASAKRAAPVDTGFLRASIYTVTSKGSTYGQALAKATTPSSKPTKSGKPRKLSKRGQAIKARMDTSLKEEISGLSSEYESVVAVAASYGFYVELGTHKMKAQPFLFPAYIKRGRVLQQVLKKIMEA